MVTLHDMELGEKIAEYQTRTGHSDRDMATALEVSHVTVGRWRRKLQYPRADEAVRLADLLGCSLDYLCRDELDEPPADPIPADMIAFIQRIGVEEAWRRLALAPGTVARPIGSTDLDPSERHPARQDKRAQQPDRPVR
jgi:transcriptional regulator with XRE-family HTH domain